jgi:cyclic nucleotide gated channel
VLGQVRLFELLEDHVLDAICERLKQKLYIEGSEVVRLKKPVERMLFIVRGKLESSGEDGETALLQEGDFCGEDFTIVVYRQDWRQQ